MSSAPARRTVFHVTAERGFSGGETQLFFLAERLRERGHRSVLVVPPDARARDEAERRGFEVRPLPMRGDFDLLALARLRALLARERPEIVHFHSMRAHVLGAPAARLAGVAGIVATRRMDYPIARHPWNALAYRRCTDLVIAISEAVRRALLRFGLPEARIRLVRSGIDLSRFDPALEPRTARARAGLPAEGRLLLCVASLHPRKDHATLLRAFARVAAGSPDLLLLLAGEGPARGSLEALARALGVEGALRFLGERGDVPQLLAACDLFVASPTSEGLGVAVLEAMAAGRAVVATRAGGLAESVLDGETGLLVPPGDSAALAAALARALADAPSRARMGRSGRARVEREFSAAAMAEGTERAYGEALAV